MFQQVLALGQLHVLKDMSLRAQSSERSNPPLWQGDCFGAEKGSIFERLTFRPSQRQAICSPVFLHAIALVLASENGKPEPGNDKIPTPPLSKDSHARRNHPRTV